MPENHRNDDRAQSFVPLTGGAMIGHYRIIEKIDAGRMGEVHLVQDIEFNRKVALKFLHTHLLCQDADCRAASNGEPKQR